MEFNELIRKFAERFGIDVPEIVDDAAAFDADGMPFLIMRAANEDGSEYLVAAADLGEPPPERMEKLYEALLDAGHAFAWAGGGVFARNPADRIRNCQGEGAWRGGGELARYNQGVPRRGFHPRSPDVRRAA